MFGFWKKSDGFEWHKYVRTTIKLRRHDRRAKVLDARDAAVDGIKVAGRQGAVAAVQGVFGLGHALRRIMQATFSAIRALPASVARAASDALRPLARWLGPRLQPMLVPFCSPGIPLVLAIIGVLATISAATRVQSGRIGGDVAIAALVALVAFTLSLAPVLTGRVRPALPKALAKHLSAIPLHVRRSLGLAGGAAFVLTAGWLLLDRSSGPVASLAALSGIAAKTVEGRAVAVTGDALRVNGSLVRLAGVEAPEARQRCTGPGRKTWRCAEAATEQLAKAVRGRTVRCELRGSDDAGRPLGRCTAGTEDIADRLVRDGSIFSSGGLFARYGSAESEARAQKAGLWRATEIERPAEFRAKLWESARKSAPDGCPIKGQVASERRTYVLPWSPDYDRVKVRATKGERWFCSESEAVGAGWKLAQRS